MLTFEIKGYDHKEKKTQGQKSYVNFSESRYKRVKIKNYRYELKRLIRFPPIQIQSFMNEI